jgi:L-ascorbate metabolism protein UlaG (beta-lactamase superfamily)
MKVKWLAHASFLITSETGTKIITDPYNVGGGLSYGEIRESADVVTVSHEHGDHNNVAAVKGNPQVVKGAGAKEAKGIKFKGVSTYHDDAQGGQRGPNTIFCFEVDGMKVCHLGDLGHTLSDKEVAEVGKVDILLVPVGGFFTIDAKVATAVSSKLAPRVIIPMHFKTDKCAYPIATVDDFIKGKSGVTQPGASEVEFKQDKLPAATQIIVLKPAL